MSNQLTEELYTGNPGGRDDVSIVIAPCANPVVDNLYETQIDGKPYYCGQKEQLIAIANKYNFKYTLINE